MTGLNSLLNDFQWTRGVTLAFVSIIYADGLQYKEHVIMTCAFSEKAKLEDNRVEIDQYLRGGLQTNGSSSTRSCVQEIRNY